ncbi:hypothetical protein RBA25_003805 [Cronobacter turicensis]|uniref:hypothetical protein n=1 Tax=Cronobacter turicensis TaxID=413502 RepID=UPI00277BB996|nr:hypothetical protein [Cronobacter turicensis]EKY3179693.1 hypothetical protein [Cronobacter turicensis]ELY4856342.1 hypothetical protein [Cronobacter turicensis]ELY5826655.1 hypothetical protein [Cronobacter turicensis]
MANNNKQSSKDVAHLAAETLNNPNASAIQKSLAGSVLSQTGTKNQTGANMEAKASAALKNPGSSEVTKTLAGSVVSQSNKKR